MEGYRELTKEEKEMVHKHKLWLAKKKGGKRADFSGYDFSRVDLSGINTKGMIFSPKTMKCAQINKIEQPITATQIHTFLTNLDLSKCSEEVKVLVKNILNKKGE